MLCVSSMLSTTQAGQSVRQANGQPYSRHGPQGESQFWPGLELAVYANPLVAVAAIAIARLMAAAMRSISVSKTH